MLDAEQPQIVGAAALHEAQIIGVIDDAGKVGVLVIDPHRHEVLAIPDFAVEADQAHSSSPCPNSRNCAGSRAGSTRPRWRKACEVSSRPRGVRWINPFWIRNGSI